MTERQFEIVLYGASGFTGKLVAEYLASEHQDLRWAIAGRNTQKLEQVRRELNLPELPILIADSAEPDSLSAMARQTRTLISTVGPYAQYGTPVLKACATEGTHYCDLTGEAQWMAEVYEQIDPIAKDSGARLVHCCGFDSIPSDLSVFFLQKQFKERFGTYATHVTGRMGRAAGGRQWWHRREPDVRCGAGFQGPRHQGAGHGPLRALPGRPGEGTGWPGSGGYRLGR
jgi:short subunit dehydrogenase-like uncharacterized protein